MVKRLARVYVFYGKGDGEELSDEFVFEDTAESRQEIIDDFGYYDFAYDSEEDFVAGKTDSFQVESGGGDWDDPTGRSVAIFDKDELIAGIKESCESEIAGIEHLFKEADE